ncbi:oligopeptide transporter, periplasmic-binding protein OppA [Gottschalkia acidurici 9a]|uniref:Oligopeptide transporter, periplasmic-binding protein OppA n=1 Tax=Gottschalkia acidurici (strain ATCC 7906 / DSM 604 / BCRC 14475 / CIP 104303 / KCTC 5404 / NCIMB 10678 / 9a) TaxID=1128398 RepID=K0AXF7_GOTA9|nr:peptide ABC transporter substrate-binding protein [Gottschalkia acidurici]AFS77400.1 oligopeptide transporter, periplasmic-binding protein OppA [Gottschalkia acidurici 9a]
MKFKKLLSLGLVSVLSLSMVLTGCGGKDNGTGDKNPSKVETELAEEQVVKVNWETEPPSLDPQISTDQVSGWILNNIYEGLVRVDKDGKIKQGSGLAKSWKVNEDETVYTFTLRDAQWSDGTPITAGDFEFAWKRALDPKVASQYADLFYHIKGGEDFNTGKTPDASQVGVKALDEKTLEVTLERPTPFFLNLTSYITFLPVQKAAVENFGDKFASEPDKMVYSGPFVIKEWTKEQKLTLEKNPKYWDAANVKLERIEGDMITDANGMANLYDTDELDVMRVPPVLVDKYKDSPDYLIEPDSVTWYMQYNLENKYMANKNIREAFALSIDKKSLVDNVRRDGSIVSQGLVPDSIQSKQGEMFGEVRGNALKDYNYNAKKAKESFEKGLKELGVTKEELEKNISYLTEDKPNAIKEAQALQQMWKQALGVEVKIETVSFKLRLDRYIRKDFSMTMSGWGADYDDPMTFISLFVTGGGNNYASYSSQEYDALVKKAIESSGDERVNTMIEAEKLLAKDLPIFPLYQATKLYLQKDYVKGVERHAAGADMSFKNAYVVKH